MDVRNNPYQPPKLNRHDLDPDELRAARIELAIVTTVSTLICAAISGVVLVIWWAVGQWIGV